MFSCHPTDKKLQHFHKTGSLFVCGRHLIVLIFKCLNRFNGNAFTLIFMLFEWFSKESLSKKKLEEKNTHKLYILWPSAGPINAHLCAVYKYVSLLYRFVGFHFVVYIRSGPLIK